MSFTQPICTLCWDNRNPARPSKGATDDFDGPGSSEHCCWCGLSTCAGIYVRVDPKLCPHPTVDLA